MSDANPSAAKSPSKPLASAQPFRLRLWPAVIVIFLLLAAMYVPPLLKLDNPILPFMGLIMGPLIAAPLLAIWWIFFSRVSWLEGFGGLAFAIICGVATYFLCDKSMAIALQIWALPWAMIICVSWLMLSFFMPWSVRRLGLLIALVSTCAVFTLLRFEGATSEFKSKISYRWESTAEQKYVAALNAKPKTELVAAEVPKLVASDEDWTAFRGAKGLSIYDGPPISESWAPNPPKQLWKRPIGPGWGSFVVVGNYLITQEQRDDKEVVSAFRVDDGEPIWEFVDKARFEESIAGAGPRSTPLFKDGKLYVVGAKGNLHCLEAATGKKIWGTSIVAKKDVADPIWGYATSPILVGNVVITLPGTPNESAVTAFDAETGKPLWATGEGKHSYTSPELATICGVPQVVAFTSAGVMGIVPESGKVLWMHKWPTDQYARCCQPYVDGDTILVSTWGDVGARKIKISKNGDKWNSEIVWEERKFNPYFNDMVVVDGNAYGYDDKLFCSVDLSTGKFNWTGGRYGGGQVLLLEKQKRLLVLTEQGEVALLEVNPTKRVELTRFKAIDGKTWNHPVVAHGKLFVRNGEEMACFDVSVPKETEAKAESR